MFSPRLALLASLFLSAQVVLGHGVLTAVTGANGITGQGFGVIASTPRDGSTPNPFEVRLVTFNGFRRLEAVHVLTWHAAVLYVGR